MRQAIVILILVLIYSVTLDAVFVAKVNVSDASFLEEIRREDDFFLYFSGIVLAPLIEELVFRGPVVLAIKEKAKKYTLCIIAMVTMFVFAYLHAGIAEFAFAYGLLLTLIAVATKALYLPIIIHSLSNLFTLVLPNAWLFELNRIVIPADTDEFNLLVHYFIIAAVTLGYAALIFFFKGKLLDISRVLASKFANEKPDNSGVYDQRLVRNKDR